MGTVPSLTWWPQGRQPGGEGDWCTLLYALALFCFHVIISPTSQASSQRWRRLSSQFSRLMFPLHQQNIWESKHKAGEAEWESQPEAQARGTAQVEGRDAQSMETCPLPGCWEHGTAVLAAGGASVQDGAFPSHSMVKKGRKTCSALKLPCKASRDGSRNIYSAGRTS